MCCVGDVEGESCGWPKGTVRATIALTTIPLGFLSLLAVMGVMIWQEQYTAALGITNGILSIVGTVVGYYFGSKQAEGAAKMASKAEHEVIKVQGEEIKLLQRGMRRRPVMADDSDTGTDVIIDMDSLN